MTEKKTSALFFIAIIFMVAACQESSTEDCPETNSVEPETTEPENTGGICEESEIPVGEGHLLVEADCPDELTERAAAIQQALISNAMAAMTLSAELLDPNKINVILCGTGTPVPSDRTQACTAVFVGGKFFLFDAGDGASRSVEGLLLPLPNLDALFITHFHSDHIAGVGEIMSRSWILGRDTTLPIYGGQAVDRLVTGFNHIYAVDNVYREAHHGSEHFPVDVAHAQANTIPDPGVTGEVVYEQDGIRILAFKVDHAPIEPALGYRIEYMGKVIAISGDTLETEGLTNLAQDADVLVSEAMNKAWVEDAECGLDAIPAASRGADIFRDIRTYHIDVAKLGETATEANVKNLMLTHLVPTPVDEGQEEELFANPIAETFSGTIQVGSDGNRFTIELSDTP